MCDDLIPQGEPVKQEGFSHHSRHKDPKPQSYTKLILCESWCFSVLVAKTSLSRSSQKEKSVAIRSIRFIRVLIQFLPKVAKFAFYDNNHPNRHRKKIMPEKKLQGYKRLTETVKCAG